MEPMFFSPERGDGRFVASDSPSTDALLCREREIVRTLQRSLDHYSRQGAKGIGIGTKERTELEAEITAQKEKNIANEKKLEDAQKELEEFRRGTEGILVKISSWIRKEKWHLPSEATRNLRSSSDIRFDAPAADICGAIESELNTLEAVAELAKQHRHKEVERRSEADINTIQQQVTRLDSQLQETQDTILELREVKNRQSAEIEDLKAQLAQEKRNREREARQHQEREQTLQEQRDREKEVSNRHARQRQQAEEKARQQAEDQAEQQARHQAREQELVQEREQDRQRAAEEQEEQERKARREQGQGADGSTPTEVHDVSILEVENLQAQLTVPVPSEVLNSATITDTTEPQVHTSEPTSPTPHLDKLFSATRRPRVRPHQIGRITSHVSNSATSVTPISKVTAKAAAMKPMVPLKPSTRAAAKAAAARGMVTPRSLSTVTGASAQVSMQLSGRIIKKRVATKTTRQGANESSES